MGIMAVTAQTNSSNQTTGNKDSGTCSICILHKSHVGSKPAGGILSLTGPAPSQSIAFNNALSDTITGTDSSRVLK